MVDPIDDPTDCRAGTCFASITSLQNGLIVEADRYDLIHVVTLLQRLIAQSRVSFAKTLHRLKRGGGRAGISFDSY